MPSQMSDHLDSPKLLGQRLRRRRTELALRQGDLSTKGISIGYISRIEAGMRTPSLQVIQHLAKQLGVEDSWLARGEKGHTLKLSKKTFEAVVDILLEAAGRAHGGHPLEVLAEIDAAAADQFTKTVLADEAAADLVELDGGRVGRAA